MADVVDLLVVAGDLAFGADGEPVLVADTPAIAQDVQHRLIESGVVAELVGDDGDGASALVTIARAAEEDARLRPGSATASVDGAGGVTIKALTLEGKALAAVVIP